MKQISQFWLAKSSAMFSKYSARKWNKVQKKEMQGKFLNFLFFKFFIFQIS